ncbi:MAG: NADH-quinone oxidoreductase subunit B, partial [Acidobacteriota bacterium]|nr:NADH-quinone oxidoreductase subunit B [Acidobacteriota bacterium]
DKFMPIDVHVPGCPPRPEALAHGILKLRDRVQGNDREGWRERYDAVGTEEVVAPASGPLAAGGPNVPEGHAGA